MLEAYRKHVAERAAEGVVPKPLDAEQVAGLVELLKNPPQGEEAFILDLLENRIPPGVDEAAYVKAGFLTAVARGEVASPLVSREKAAELLGTMQGGYNIEPLIELLDDSALAPIAAKALSHTLLMFDNFYDVEEKAKAGNPFAKQVLQSWADAEWFLSKPALPEKVTLTVFKVTGETNTDDLSPAPDAWSRPDIPVHALAMLKNARDGIEPDVPGKVGPIKQIEALKAKGHQLVYVGDVVGMPVHHVNRQPTQCCGLWETIFLMCLISARADMCLAVKSLQSSLTPWKMLARCRSKWMSLSSIWAM